jgi:type VI secretion system secreted protein Hcp
MFIQYARARLPCIAAVFILCAIIAMPGSASAAYEAFLWIEAIPGTSTPEKSIAGKSIPEESSPGIPVPGESMDQWHKNHIDILSWSFGAYVPAGSSPAARAGAKYKTHERDFRFTMKVNRASPILFRLCAERRQIKSVTLFVRNAKSKERDYLVITLGGVLVSSFQSSGESKGQDDRPIDAVTLTFETIKINYKQIKLDGTLLDGCPTECDFSNKVATCR